jgi:uncharacterized protein involved in exopolysaccharide biosynthesis
MISPGPRTFAKCLRAARRRKLLILVPGLILGVGTVLALSKLPDRYKASAKLVVNASGPESKIQLQSYLDKCRELLSPPNRLESVRSPNAAVPADTHPPEPIAIEPDASPGAQPGTFTVSYIATDPELARAGANELAGLLVAQTAKLRPPAARKLEPLRIQTADLAERIEQLEQTYPWLTDARAQARAQPAHVQPSAEALRAQQMNIESLQDQQYKFQQQLNDVERRIAYQRQIVEQQKKGGSLRESHTYAVLIAKRAELQGQRDTLINRQELTDKHPRVAAIDDQIAAINRQIDELRSQEAGLSSQSPEARELASLESERNRLKVDLEVTGRELARRRSSQPLGHPSAEPAPPRRDLADSKLMRSYLELKRSYAQATAELREAEAAVPQDGGAQVQLVESATLPTRPAGTRRAILISLASATGLALGFVLMLWAERLRLRSLQDALDVEYFARLTLLGSIPKTRTPAERRRAWWRAAAKLAAGTALSAAATLALSHFFVAINILELIARK